MTTPGELTLSPIVVHGIAATLLFSRASRITVGTVEIENIGAKQGLDVSFSVRRSLRAKEPNTCSLKIWNLSPNSLHALEKSAEPAETLTTPPGGSNLVVPVKIEAGYEGHMSTIFLGEMRSAQTVRDGADFVTELLTGDGDQAGAVARISDSFGPTDAYAVTQVLLAAMPCGTGNLPAFASVLRSSTLYGAGVTLKGNPVTILTDLARSIGLEFTIQGGQAQFLSLGLPIDGAPYSLDSSSGLLDEPSVDTKGVLACTTLMLPGLRPGSLIVLDSLFVQGQYRITSLVTTGDTAGADWSHKIEAELPGAPVGKRKKGKK